MKGQQKSAKKPRKLIERPYASGTLTRAAFFQMIRSALRNKSRWWKPISDCKALARRKNQGKNKRLKWEFQCNSCKEWFPDQEVCVDHITEAGSLNTLNDLPKFVGNLFCEVDGLQVLCKKKCHLEKTNDYKLTVKQLKTEAYEDNN